MPTTLTASLAFCLGRPVFRLLYSTKFLKSVAKRKHFSWAGPLAVSMQAGGGTPTDDYLGHWDFIDSLSYDRIHVVGHFLTKLIYIYIPKCLF